MSTITVTDAEIASALTPETVSPTERAPLRWVPRRLLKARVAEEGPRTPAAQGRG
jgi:hypothetical protein